MFYFDKTAEEKVAEDIEIAQEIADTDLPTETKVEILEEYGVEPEIIDEVVNADVQAAYAAMNPYWFNDKTAELDQDGEEVPAGVDPTTWEQVKAWLEQRGIDAQEWIADPQNQQLLIGGGLAGLLGAGAGYALGGGTGAMLGGLAGAGLGGFGGYNFGSNPQMANTALGAGIGGLAGAGLGYLAGGGTGALLGGLAGAGLGGAGGYMYPDYADVLSACNNSKWLADKLAAKMTPEQQREQYKKRSVEDTRREMGNKSAKAQQNNQKVVDDYADALRDDQAEPTEATAKRRQKASKAWTNQATAMRNGAASMGELRRNSAIGAGLGALTGAGLGYLAGGDGKGALLGGLAGAGLGAYGGYNFNNMRNAFGFDGGPTVDMYSRYVMPY